MRRSLPPARSALAPRAAAALALAAIVALAGLAASLPLPSAAAGADPGPQLQGNWVGSYGAGGYALAAWNGSSDLTSLSGVALSLLSGGRYVWSAQTADVRALQSPDQSTRQAATWYDPHQIQLQLSFSAAYAGNLELYAVDWDAGGLRRETITVNGQSAQLASDFSQGEWVIFPITVAAGGLVSINVTNNAGNVTNAVLSGIFLGGGSGASPPPQQSSAPQGNWVGSYGAGGYALAAWNGSSDLTSLSGVSLSLLSGGRYVWSAQTADVRALQSPDQSTRQAATWYDPHQIQLQLSFSAAYAGNLELYAVDWDAGGLRRETITVNGQSAQLASDFSQGEWVIFPITVAAGGLVSINVTNNAGNVTNAVLSGIFLGAAGAPAPFNQCNPAALPAPAPASAPYTIIVDGQMTAAGQEADYAALANANTTLAFRSVAQPIPDYPGGPFAYAPPSANTQVQYWQAAGYPFYYTAVSSDFQQAGLPLFVAQCSADAALRMTDSRGLYLHELVTDLAAQNGYQWAQAVAAITPAQWQTLDYWVSLARALNKKVIWSEPAEGWMALLANSTADGYLQNWGATLVPTFATNFESPTSGHLMGIAAAWAAQAASRYGMSLGESVQSWYFREQTDLAAQIQAGLPTAGASGYPAPFGNGFSGGYELDPLNSDSYFVGGAYFGDPLNQTLVNQEPVLAPTASATVALADFGATLGATYYEVEGTNGVYQVAAQGSYGPVDDMAWPAPSQPSVFMQGIEQFSAQLAAGAAPPAQVPTTPLYQLWNSSLVSHYYTTSMADAQTKEAAGYAYQEVTGYVATTPAPGTIALYEYQNAAGGYYYTTSQSGVPAGFSLAGNVSGLGNGVVGYVMASQQPGTEPWYWMAATYDGHADRFYTTDADYERPSALGSFFGYHDLGVECYLFTYGPSAAATQLPGSA